VLVCRCEDAAEAVGKKEIVDGAVGRVLAGAVAEGVVGVDKGNAIGFLSGFEEALGGVGVAGNFLLRGVEGLGEGQEAAHGVVLPAGGGGASGAVGIRDGAGLGAEVSGGVVCFIFGEKKSAGGAFLFDADGAAVGVLGFNGLQTEGVDDGLLEDFLAEGIDIFVVVEGLGDVAEGVGGLDEAV